MKNIRILLITIILCHAAVTHAQFYTIGDDPGRLKWYSIESPEYQIIYPAGLDSLARVYGTLLEQWRTEVGASAGYAPGEMTRRKLPVVLHPYNSQSNGSVAWAPRRMDLFTSPESSGAEAMPWEKMLAIHESRHVAQMQFGQSNVFRPFYWFFGEMFSGAMAGVYPGRWMMEGDAVVAETALTDAGRGRSADFLNYYMTCFDSGDFRNWNRWRYGSYRYYTPDHYALGYMTISGIRYMTGDPYFTGTFLHHVSKRPYDAFSYRTVSKNLTGKGLRATFDDVTRLFHEMWTEEKTLRAPFMPHEEISGQAGKTRKEYTEYSDIFLVSDTLYSIRQGMGKSRSLVRIGRDGKEKTVTTFGTLSGNIWHSPDSRTIWWSEYIVDERWSLKTDSKIRSLDLDKGRKRTFTGAGKRFNPTVSQDGKCLLAVNYPVEGGSEIEIYDIESGNLTRVLKSPDTLQVTEAVQTADRIFMAGISDGGYGLYSAAIDAGQTVIGRHARWKTELAPRPVKIVRLKPYGEDLLFTSDRNGVNELYRFSAGDGRLFQMTSTEYGASDFAFSEDGETLFYSTGRRYGRPIMSTSTASLPQKEVRFSDIHHYRIADELSRQEREIAAEKGLGVSDSMKVTFSEPERYRKFPHLFNVHSWAPVYFNVDNIMNMSYDYYHELASPGAAAVIQNSLGTMTANFGYSAHRDPYATDKWRHSGHAQFTYTGLYPVIEASVDFNDRAARDYSFSIYELQDIPAIASGNSGASSRPYVEGNLSVYIPFSFSSGGWNRGLIPRVSYTLSNDTYDTGAYFYSLLPAEEPSYAVFKGRSAGKRMLRQTVSGSIRGYAMRPAAQSEIYPDWGIGIEAGAGMDAGLTDWLSPAGYLYCYGYIPGITSCQGLRLTATWQGQLKRNSIFATSMVNTLPRGFAGAEELRSLVSGYGQSAKLTADYAIPIYLGDFSIGPVFYGKRAVLTPHFDYTFFDGGGLFSAGATLQIEFGCFFWIGTPVSIGITWSYNGGPSWNALRDRGLSLKRNYVGPVFNFSIPN